LPAVRAGAATLEDVLELLLMKLPDDAALIVPARTAACIAMGPGITCVDGGRITEAGVASDRVCTFVALVVDCEVASLRGAVTPAVLPVLGVEDDSGASDGLDF
jgi:hypothetical protein